MVDLKLSVWERVGREEHPEFILHNVRKINLNPKNPDNYALNCIVGDYLKSDPAKLVVIMSGVPMIIRTADSKMYTVLADAKLDGQDIEGHILEYEELLAKNESEKLQDEATN